VLLRQLGDAAGSWFFVGVCMLRMATVVTVCGSRSRVKIRVVFRVGVHHNPLILIALQALMTCVCNIGGHFLNITLRLKDVSSPRPAKGLEVTSTALGQMARQVRRVIGHTNKCQARCASTNHGAPMQSDCLPRTFSAPRVDAKLKTW